MMLERIIYRWPIATIVPLKAEPALSLRYCPSLELVLAVAAGVLFFLLLL